MMFSVLRRITGVDLLEDLAEFFQAFSGMVGGFRERARRVNELLADDRTAFLVVCAPQAGADRRGTALPSQAARGRAARSSARSSTASTTRPSSTSSATSSASELRERPGDDDLAGGVADNFGDFRELSRADRANIDHLTAELRRSDAVIEVPYLDHDVHDLAGLLEVDRYLFGA